MKMLAPDHNPALRGRRIVICLKRWSRTIFRGGDRRGCRAVSLRQLLAHSRTRLRRQSCAAAGTSLGHALSQLLPDSGDVGL